MLKFNEIKKDYNDGIRYAHYSCTWYSYDVSVYMDLNRLHIHFNKFYVSKGKTYHKKIYTSLDVGSFMNMTYSDFVSFIRNKMHDGTFLFRVD